MYQSLSIIGNAGQDAEMRYLENGTPVTTFTVAVNERYGERETTTWFRVTCWRKLAEVCAQYVTKGKLVLVTGRVSARAYTNRQGEAACSLDVTADVVKFLSAPAHHAEDEPGLSTANGTPVSTFSKNGADPAPEAEMDIPF